MDLNSIRNALRAQPFQPFDLCLADGRRVAVMHPEFVAMTNRIVVVLDEHNFSKTIEPLLIVSLEPTPAPGSAKRRLRGPGWVNPEMMTRQWRRACELRQCAPKLLLHWMTGRPSPRIRRGTCGC